MNESIFVELYREREWGQTAAMSARNRRARELRRQGYNVECKSSNNPFDGQRLYHLTAVHKDYRGPQVTYFDSVNGPKNVYIVLPDGRRV